MAEVDQEQVICILLTIAALLPLVDGDATTLLGIIVIVQS